MIRPRNVATRGYLQGNTLGIASRGYLDVEVEVVDEIGGRGSAGPNYRKVGRLQNDDEEILFIMKIFSELCL